MKTFVELKLFATLQRFKPDNAEQFPIEAGSTVRDLIQKLNITRTQSKLVFVNSVKVELDTVLTGGERVGIFPPVGGG